jgi:hypothetical protein
MITASAHERVGVKVSSTARIVRQSALSFNRRKLAKYLI